MVNSSSGGGNMLDRSAEPTRIDRQFPLTVDKVFQPSGPRSFNRGVCLDGIRLEIDVMAKQVSASRAATGCGGP